MTRPASVEEPQYSGRPGAPKPTRAWTVLAYVVADDTTAVDDAESSELIDRVAHEEVDKLVSAARGRDNIYLAVQADFSRTRGTLQVDPDGTRRNAPEETANLAGFRDFAQRVRAEYPAEHCMVVVWGHGAGPLGFFSDGDGSNGNGDRGGNLSLSDLAKALLATSPGEPTTSRQRAKGASAVPSGPVDVLLIKSCYAATLEAAYELRGAVRFLVSSQAKVPIRTWTIWEVFEQLNQHTTDPQEAAGHLLRALGKHYGDAAERLFREEVPFSLVDVAQLEPAGHGLKQLADALVARRFDDAIQAAIDASRPQDTGDAALLDVMTFCASLSSTPEVGALADQLANMVRAAVVAREPSESRFTGLGLFHLPEPLLRMESFSNEVSVGSYGSLRLEAASNWSRVAFDL